MTPLLITGVPRTGTSKVAHEYAEKGYWYGTSLIDKQWQPGEGRFYENVHLRKLLQRSAELHGGDETGLLPYDHQGDDILTRGNITAIIKGDGYTGGPWLWKDSRLLAVAPTLCEIWPDATWIVTSRNWRDTMASWNRCSIGTNCPTSASYDWLYGLQHHLGRYTTNVFVKVYP